MTLDNARLALEQLKVDLKKAHLMVSSPVNRATLQETLRLVEEALEASASVVDARDLRTIVRNAATALKNDPQHETNSAAETALERVRQDMTRVFTDLDAEIRRRI